MFILEILSVYSRSYENYNSTIPPFWKKESESALPIELTENDILLSNNSKSFSRDRFKRETAEHKEEQPSVLTAEDPIFLYNDSFFKNLSKHERRKKRETNSPKKFLIDSIVAENKEELVDTYNKDIKSKLESKISLHNQKNLAKLKTIIETITLYLNEKNTQAMNLVISELRSKMSNFLSDSRQYHNQALDSYRQAMTDNNIEGPVVFKYGSVLIKAIEKLYSSVDSLIETIDTNVRSELFERIKNEDDNFYNHIADLMADSHTEETIFNLSGDTMPGAVKIFIDKQVYLANEVMKLINFFAIKLDASAILFTEEVPVLKQKIENISLGLKNNILRSLNDLNEKIFEHMNQKIGYLRQQLVKSFDVANDMLFNDIIRLIRDQNVLFNTDVNEVFDSL